MSGSKNRGASRPEASGLTATFDVRGLDMGNPLEVEARWNDWTKRLYAEGFRPSEDPISCTEDGWVHALYAVGGLRDTAAVIPTLAVA